MHLNIDLQLTKFQGITLAITLLNMELIKVIPIIDTK